MNAIEENVNVCAYSGELSAMNFLNWVLLQNVERKYLDVKTDERTGRVYAVVPYEIQKRIKAYISGKFFLFDNTSVNPNETEEDSIFRVFNTCARRFGIKLFLVDNLMSLTAGNSNELETQTRIASKLKKFAVKFQAHVLLVCHPRKTKEGETFTNDTISGSANITNLADSVIVVQKPSLSVLKNRAYGDTGYIECAYDPANRRIFQEDIGDTVVYGWDHTGLESYERNIVDQYPEFNIRHQEHDSPICTTPF